uniref:Uncharacterized protein n=1 Tax=Arundo donax TaxID=35708 RepID=A0A0A9C7A2_ARUDO
MLGVRNLLLSPLCRVRLVQVGWPTSRDRRNLLL